MRSFRQPPGIFRGIDTRPVQREGALVYPFDQYGEISQTDFPDGLCWGFSASIIRRLSAGDDGVVKLYQNPLPRPILNEAIELTRVSIELYKDGRDRDIEKVPFSGKRPRKVSVSAGEMSPYISPRTKSATLTYPMKNGDRHVLSFFNKGPDECVVQDANRFTIDRLRISSGKQILKEIVQRSDPKEVEIAFDPSRRCSL